MGFWNWVTYSVAGNRHLLFIQEVQITPAISLQCNSCELGCTVEGGKYISWYDTEGV